MTHGKQHLRFSVELWSKTGHEALVSHFEGELKHLEHVKEYVNKRAKTELDYAAALGKISTAASKFISNSDYESPIKKAWCTYITESEKKAKLITEFANQLNSTTIRKLEQLIDDKRTLLKRYRNERFKIESCFKQESDEIDRLRKTYHDNAKESEYGKRKYEEAVQKEKSHTKDWEKSKDKYVKTTLKLHQNHNDYVLALTSGNCHMGFFNEILIPKTLNSVQYLEEEYVAEWQDLLNETFDLTNCCRKEFWSSSQEVQSAIDQVNKQQEYVTFITKHRQKPAPVYPFMFDPALIEMTSSGVIQNELVVNDLTLEKLQHKKTLLHKDLDGVVSQLQTKEAELEEETNSLQEGRLGKDKFSIIQKEQTIAVLNWNIEQLKCAQGKLQKMCTQISSALDRLGNAPPPKFADLSTPSFAAAGEFGQSTPEIRRSAKKISTLFKKKERIEKETSQHSPQISYQAAGYEPQNGMVDGVSDEEALGEYLEPDDEIPLEDEDWFHGTIDRKDVSALLKNDGDFLVRESGSKRGQFVLSASSSGEIKHFIIQNSDDGFVRFEDQSFPSIRKLLDYHIINKIPVTKKTLAILANPVLRSVKDKWELCRDNIILDKKLGQGHFGDVMKGFLKPNNMPVAVKSCRESVTETAKKKFLSEAEILKQYNHPNIVRLIGVCAEREPVFIVMEFMPGGDFLVYLRKHGMKLNQQHLVKFSIDAAAGMEYLARYNCIHRDLAARNCLIGDGDVLKISDFGMSREVEEVYQASNMKEIPVKWTAPEALNYTTYTTLSDIWSFGVLLWETFSLGNQPYPGFSNKETREKVDCGYRMPAPAETPPAVYQIMRDCWKVNPNERPSFSEIYRRLRQIQDVLRD